MKGEFLSLETTKKLASREKAIKYIKDKIMESKITGNATLNISELLNILEAKDETK